MKTCPKCGIQLEDFVEFCPVCGADTPIRQTSFQQPKQKIGLPPPPYLDEKKRRLELKEQRRAEKERQREQKRLEKMQKRMQRTKDKMPLPPQMNQPAIPPPPTESPPKFFGETRVPKVKTRQTTKPEEIKKCSICGSFLIHVKQYNKWYCQKCRKYR